MIGVVDKEAEIDVETLQEVIDDLEPSTDRSVPSMTGIRTLATEVTASDADLRERTIESVLDEIPRLLEHDRSTVHRIAAVAAVVLVDAEPDAADRLLDRLVPMLSETAYERRTLETLEYVSIGAPDAIGPHLPAVMAFLDSPRDAVARHAAGIVLALAKEAPERVLGSIPRLLSSLAASSESCESIAVDRESTGKTDVRSLERNRQLEHVSVRLLVARAIATVVQARPETTADVVVESGTSEVVVALFDDEQPRVRAAALVIASHVAERDPQPFESAISRVIELLEDENEIVRGGAIWTLRALDHPRAVEGLRRASRTDSTAELRELAAEGVRTAEKRAETPNRTMQRSSTHDSNK